MLSRVINGLRGTTLRTRLTIWNAAVVLLITAVTLLAVRFAARRAFYADADLAFRAASREIALAVREGRPWRVIIPGYFYTLEYIENRVNFTVTSGLVTKVTRG